MLIRGLVAVNNLEKKKAAGEGSFQNPSLWQGFTKPLVSSREAIR
jgi:hypothetical protein